MAIQMQLNGDLHFLAHNGNCRLKIGRAQIIGGITQSPQRIVTLPVADRNGNGFAFCQSNLFFGAIHQFLQNGQSFVRITSESPTCLRC
jgi:hypothetical protein